MRVVFLGSGAFGLPTIDRLAREHELVAVVTQPDRPAGRNKALTPTPIGAWAGERVPGVPLLKPEQVNEASVRDRVRSIEADAWVVVAFGQYLGTALLRDRFAFNLHGSRLPRWRGAAPVNHAILAGDVVSGNSIITIARRMDAGDVLSMSARAIGAMMTAGELHDRLAEDGPELVLGVLEDLARGRVEPTAQDESMVTTAPKLSREDAMIDFERTGDRVRCRINGLSPWPGVAVDFRGARVKLVRAGPGENIAGRDEPGTLVDASSGLVACGAGSAVRLLEVQPAGRTVQDWSAFANGAKPRDGEVLRGIR